MIAHLSRVAYPAPLAAIAWVLALTLSPAGLLAQEPPGPPPAEMVVRATGDGFPAAGATGGAAVLGAKRAATVVALRNLAVAVGAMVPGGESGEWASELVKGHKVVGIEDLPGGGYRATVELPVAHLAVALHGELARTAALATELRASKDKAAALESELAALRASADAMRRRYDELVAALARTVDQLRALVEAAQGATK